MRESLRRRLRLPPLHPPPPPPPPIPRSQHHPPPPLPLPRSQHHPPNDDDLEEGELKDVDSHHLIKRKDEPDEEDEGRIVQSSHVKEIESDERGLVADEPECPVDEQKIELNEKHEEEDEEGRPETQPVLEDNVVNAAAVMDDDVNQGVLESEVEEREKQSGELEDRVLGGEDVMERNETEKGGGETVEKVAVDDAANLAVPEGEEEDKNIEEGREISTEQHPGGGGGKVENDVVIEVVEETGQPAMPVEETQNLIDNQDEATALPAGENEGKTDDEQVGQPDLAMEEVEKVTEKDDDDEEEDGPPPGWESGPPVNPLLPLPPPPPPPPPEKGQLVCGSCRRLLSYPRGFKHVQCSCCQTVNYVLEEHQVGQVQCGNCLLLLMYPFGAPSVRCCSCRFVTDIGDRNKRPRLSEQQSRACRPFCVQL